MSIQAIPWGFVSIDGHGRTETPVQKVSVLEGTHHIEVFYEPENKRLTKVISLKPNQHLLCIANFQKKDENSLSCSDLKL